jgi:UDP-glucose 4-epimerase
MKSKIFITGANGFIGKELVNQLLNLGHKVVAFDLSFDHKNKTKNLVQVKGSILNELELFKAMNNCSYVVHLAAALGVQYTERNRLECFDINIEGTKKVLEASVKNRVKKIIFSSSSEVYGNQIENFFDENTNLQVLSNYGISKIVGEEYLRAYYEKYKLKYNIVRFFNVYGTNQRDNFVMTKFIKSIINKENLYIYGNGNQMRSFCHVSDAVKGIILVLKKGKLNSTYNIGNDKEPIKMYDLAKKCKNYLGSNAKIIKIDYRYSDRLKSREVIKRIPGIKKIRKELKFKPSIMLKEGIHRIYKSLNNNLESPQIKKALK